MRTKRNGSKRLCAVLLLSAFLLIPLAGAAAEILNGSFFGGRAAEPADAAECHTLEPHASEGVIITVSEEDSLTVEAHEQDGKLVFDETKTLVFRRSLRRAGASARIIPFSSRTIRARIPSSTGTAA